jgi:alpha-N-arabinofuranosidase
VSEALIFETKVLTSCSNVNSTVVPLSVAIETPWTSVNGTIITNPDVNGFNYKNNATAITPQPLNLTSTTPGSNGIWTWNVP